MKINQNTTEKKMMTNEQELNKRLKRRKILKIIARIRRFLHRRVEAYIRDVM